jgi:hypothetical protein
VLPLAMASVTVNEVCLICMDLFPSAEGYTCANKHFICWECVNGYIGSQIASPLAERSLHASSGELKCAVGGCDECYTLDSIKGNGEALNGLAKLKSTIETEREVNIAINNEKQKIMAEFEKIQKIKNQKVRKAHVLRQEIVNNILTLKCPRALCSMAFVDFERCFALTCPGCKCGFCAWCLKDCGTDAHAHVLQCPEGIRGSYHGTFQQFQSHHDARKCRLIDSKLQSEAQDSALVAAIAYRLVLEDLKGTNIVLNFKPTVSDDEIDRNISGGGDGGGGGGGGGGGMDAIPWAIQPFKRDKGMVLYQITKENVGVDVSKEMYEFTVASGHFLRLLQQNMDITRVEALEYDDNSSVRQNYEREKQQHPPDQNDPSSKEIWVFHGTAPQNVYAIASGGFKVGGSGVNIANGAAYGNGVYTATGPNTPMAFSKNSRCVILCKGLLCGSNGHVAPHKDYIIFKRGSQLLPSYIVYF